MTEAIFDGAPLQLGVLTEGALKPPVKARHRVALSAAEAIVLDVFQRDFDLAVEILDPEGKPAHVFDGPYDTGAAEHICFVAVKEGYHEVQISAYGDRGGEYGIRVEERHPARPEDRRCFEASQRFMSAEAKRVESQPTADLATTFDEIHKSWADAGQPFLAAVALRQAGLLWKALGSGEEAQRCFVGALVLALEGGSPYLEIRLRIDLGQTLVGGQDSPRGRREFERALEKAKSEGLTALEATSLSYLAWIDQQHGEVHRAIAQYRAALEIGREILPAHERAQIQTQLAEAYSLLDHHQEALRLMTAALETLRGVGRDAPRELRALMAMGWLHYLMGQPEAGLPFLGQALDLARTTGNREFEIGVLDRLGTVRRADGDLEGALEAYRASLELSTKVGHLRSMTHTTINLGCLYQQWNRPQDALEHLGRARPEMARVGDWDALSYLEYCEAKALRDLGRIDQALDHIVAARQAVAKLRDMARVHGNRFGPIWLWQDYAELHLELLMKKARQSGDRSFEVEAFEMIDLVRSQRLFELVLEGQIGVRSTASKDLLDRESVIRRQLNALAELRLNGDSLANGDPDGLALARQLDDLMLELERVRSAIRAADLRYSQLVVPRRLSLDELRRHLSPGTLLLRYVLAKEESYLFVVGQDYWNIFRLEGGKTLEPKVQTVYLALRRAREPDLQAAFTAYHLGQELLPAGSIPEGTRRLLIVADGPLNYLPFAVLSSPFQDGRTEDLEFRQILDDLEILSLPSAAFLVTLHGATPTSDLPIRSAAVFGDPVFSDLDHRLGTALPSLCGSGLRSISIERLPSGDLPRLPCTRREGEALLDRIEDANELAAFDFEANKHALATADLSRYRILHLATHAFVDEQFPELSGLVLARRDRAGRPIDGNLYLHEIYALDLDADLVTLSGCQTALGRNVRGDGLLSMAWGFFYAGARRVLVSLWSVDDEATSELMARFYEGLLDRRESPMQALRSAQIWMRDESRWPAPYYWAGFVLQGRP